MGTRSLQASQKGIGRAKIALADYALSQNELAEELEMSRQTVNNFFKGKPISRDNFRAICDRLGLDLENTVAIRSVEASHDNQIPDSELDALVQEVRQKVHANIQKRCGEMRVLDMTRPIDLDTIYTDVNILQDITGRRRLDLAELLKNCSLEEFDRLGFAHAQVERRSGLEAVEEFDHLMLLGKPGGGKTTFLKRLAALCNRGAFQGERVPIFITLKDFGDSAEKPELLIYISRWFNEWGLQEPQKVEQILQQGRGFLLLDGLDEVSENVSKQVIQEIQSFANRFSQNAFVVSCRIAAKEFTFQQFTEVEVADFNDKQIANFATRWFQAKNLAEKAKNFLEKLKAHPRIKELATNPLLLTLLCLVFEGRTDFPANRSELYEEGLDILLKKWDGTRSIERELVYRELSLKRKEDLLSQLAFTTFEPANYFFKKKEAEHLIETYIQNLPGAKSDPEALRLDSEAVLKSIESQHGLFVERARGIYSFSHLTFHEYFTARKIVTSANSEALLKNLSTRITEKRWREVFLLAVGMLDSADELLRAMKQAIDYLLARDSQLQQFLTWVTEKSGSTQISHTLTSNRAFYFRLAHNHNLAYLLDRVIDYKLDIARTLAREYPYPAPNPDHTLDCDITSHLDDSIATTLDHETDNINLIPAHTITFDPDWTTDRALVTAHTIATDRVITHTIATDRIIAHAITIARAVDLAITHAPYLKRLLQNLKNQLPDPQKDWDYFEKWWEINGKTWTEELRAVMIEHRDIGHNWQFIDAQEQLLQQYYDANQLLVDCLNSDCYVSREVRQEIEDSLLLPIAEIEKRFPNQRRQP